MNLDPLGALTRDTDIEEWFHGGYLNVPYLDGQELQIIVQDIEADSVPADFSEAIRQFLALTVADRAEATPYVFGNYREFVEAVGEEEFDFTIVPRRTSGIMFL